jgi:polar amino acid transport system ATP-binding protein
MTQAEPFIRLANVRKSFGALTVLDGISLSVDRGAVVCVIGPSGSGKSTLLRCINGLTPIDSGEVQVGGYAVHDLRGRQFIPLRRDVSMVFQQYNLFPHRTILQNVMMAPIQVLKESRREVEPRAREVLRKVHLLGKENDYPAQLSGGQQQRVAIARSLAMRPRAILFDEITAALDPEMVSEVLGVVRDVASEGMTCVLVTHEMRFAEEIADMVFFTDRGVIVESGPPAQLFHAPKDARLQAFLDKVL